MASETADEPPKQKPARRHDHPRVIAGASSPRKSLRAVAARNSGRWGGRKTPSESDRNRLTPTAAPCTIRGPPYSPTGHIIPSTSISNDHPRPDIRLRAQLNCSTTCLVPVGPEAIPLGPNSVWRAVWGDSKRTPQWSDTARILQILLFVSSASDPQARAPAPSGVLRRAALPSADIVG